MRSLSFTRSSAGVADLGDAVGERRRHRQDRDLVDHPRDLGTLDRGAVQRRGADPQLADRLAEQLPGRHHLDRRAHAPQHVDEGDARRVQRDVLDHESEPGVIVAATTKNAADDGSPGTSSSKGRGAPAVTRTARSSTR